MFGVAIHQPVNSSWQSQWSFVLSNFTPDMVWIVGCPEGERPLHKGAICIGHMSELPAGPEKVVLAPPAGRFVAGTISLLDFRHPHDVIYVFGPDSQHLAIEDLPERVDHRVFVPTDTHHEMWSWVCAAVVFWDRKVRHG